MEKRLHASCLLARLAVLYQCHRFSVRSDFMSESCISYLATLSKQSFCLLTSLIPSLSGSLLFLFLTYL
jgi:hypothetical protein